MRLSTPRLRGCRNLLPAAIFWCSPRMTPHITRAHLRRQSTTTSMATLTSFCGPVHTAALTAAWRACATPLSEQGAPTGAGTASGNAVWEKVVDAFQLRRRNNGIEGSSSSQHQQLWHTVEPIIVLWRTYYHPRLFSHSKCSESASSALMPTEDEVDHVPAFLQALCYSIQFLEYLNVSSEGGETVNGTDAIPSEEERVTYIEGMRSLVLTLATYRLPYYAVLDSSAASANFHRETSTTQQAIFSSSVCPTGCSGVLASSQSKHHSESALLDISDGASRAIRFVPRDHERVCALVAPLSPEAQLRATVLLDTLHVMLSTNALFSSSAPADDEVKGSQHHRVRSRLYTLAVPVVAAVEQLDSSAVATLAGCLARCAESYATQQMINTFSSSVAAGASSGLEDGQGEKGKNAGMESSAEEDTLNESELLQWFLRPVGFEAASGCESACVKVGLSAEERAEEEAARKARGSTNSLLSVMPTTIVAHMHIIAGVLRTRMDKVLLDYQQEAHVALQADGGDATQYWRDTMQQEKVFEARRLAEMGRQGIMSLASRKQQQQHSGRISTASRKRKTLASYTTATAGAEAETAANVPGSQSQSPYPESTSTNAFTTELDTITLTDVAEASSALAVSRYGDALYWECVTRFTCWSIFTYAQDRARHNDTSLSTSAFTTSEEEEEEREEMAFLREMRDICFALDKARQVPQYDRVMETLVHHGLLVAPLPAPTVASRAMSTVAGQHIR